MPDRPWPRLDDRPMTIVTPDGVHLHAQVHGPEHADATAVLLHGYQLSQKLWGRQVHALLEAHPALRVVTYDHRGHGRSTRGTTESATLGQLGRDLRTVLEALAQGPVVLIGHSMGGMTVMALAEQLPHLVRDRVAAVALLATSSGSLAENTFGLHPVLARVVHAVVPRANGWVRRRVERGAGKPPSPGTRWLLFGEQAHRADVLRTQEVLDGTHPVTADDFYGTFGQHARTHALAHLAEVPVLVAAGERDRLTPLAHARAIAEALPHARFVVYPGCGHMVQLERAHDVSRRLVELVATALPTAARRAG